jgi:hypothetical protein
MKSRRTSARYAIASVILAIVLSGPAAALGAEKCYYVGGGEPTGLGSGNYEWRSSGVDAAYNTIMDLNDGNTWEIRVAADYNESPSTTVVMDGKTTGGAGSTSKVRGIYGARVWDANTASHAAVTADHTRRSTLDGNYSTGWLVNISSASGMSTGPVIDGLKLYRGHIPGYSQCAALVFTAAIAKTTLSNLEICYCKGTGGDARSGVIGGNGVNVGNDCVITDCYIHDNGNDPTDGDQLNSLINLGPASRMLVKNCKVSNNKVKSVAGVAWNGDDCCAVVNCEFTGNTLKDSAILYSGRSGATFVNVLIADNHSAANVNAYARATGYCNT